MPPAQEPTFLWVLLELGREWIQENDISVSVLPRDSEDLTDQLQSLFLWHFWPRQRLLGEQNNQHLICTCVSPCTIRYRSLLRGFSLTPKVWSPFPAPPALSGGVSLHWVEAAQCPGEAVSACLQLRMPKDPVAALLLWLQARLYQLTLLLTRHKEQRHLMSTAKFVVETSLNWCFISLWLYFTWALKSNDRKDSLRSGLELCTCFLFLH